MFIFVLGYFIFNRHLKFSIICQNFNLYFFPVRLLNNESCKPCLDKKGEFTKELNRDDIFVNLGKNLNELDQKQLVSCNKIKIFCAF